MKKIFLGHLDIGELDARLPCSANAALGTIAAEDFNTLHVGSANQGADCVLFFSCLWIFQFLFCHDGEETSKRRACGPFLFTIEDVEVSARTDFTTRFLATGVATNIGLA